MKLNRGVWLRQVVKTVRVRDLPAIIVEERLGSKVRYRWMLGARDIGFPKLTIEAAVADLKSDVKRNQDGDE